jgi:hypothetical protein
MMELPEESSGLARSEGTGSNDFLAHSRIIELPFDKYLIKIRVSDTNELLSIEEVHVNKEFLSQSQMLSRVSRQGYHDVDEYYKDEEE